MSYLFIHIACLLLVKTKKILIMIKPIYNHVRTHLIKRLQAGLHLFNYVYFEGNDLFFNTSLTFLCLWQTVSLVADDQASLNMVVTNSVCLSDSMKMTKIMNK